MANHTPRKTWLNSLRPGDTVLLPRHNPGGIVERQITANGPKYITLAGGARVLKDTGKLENPPHTAIYATVEAYQQDVRLWARLHDIAEGIRTLCMQRKPESLTVEEVNHLQAAFIALTSDKKQGGV